MGGVAMLKKPHLINIQILIQCQLLVTPVLLSGDPGILQNQKGD
jgi:hypothetical protein